MGAALPIERQRPPLQLAAYAECYCGKTHIFDRRVGLPAGWREVELDGEKAVKCPDCARPTDEPLLIPAAANDAKASHHGCRVFHSHVAPGAVVLRIHAGARPVGDAASDRPVHFLARTADLDELIAALEGIRAEFTSNRGK